MVTTYTTTGRIASLLQYSENSSDGLSQIRKNFDANTLPTATEVEETINETEDWIDEYCERSWREKTITNEYHNFESGRGNWGSYIDRSGYRIYVITLKKFFARTFDTAQGDKIEGYLSSGSGWFDFVANGTLGSAMYDGDYYIDYELNRIFFFNKFPQVGKKMFRITYRTGESTVPGGIKRACSLLAGAMINERYELFAFADKDTNPALSQAEKWTERAYKILDKYKITAEIEVI